MLVRVELPWDRRSRSPCCPRRGGNGYPCELDDAERDPATARSSRTHSHSSVGQGLLTGSKRHSLTAPKPP